MKSAFGFLLALSLLTPVLYTQEFQLGSSVERVGSLATVPLTLSSNANIDGLVAIFEWDAAVAQGFDIIEEPGIEAAEEVFLRLEDNFAVVGILVDADGLGLAALPAADDLLIASIRLRCGETAGTTALTFVDDTYGVVAGGAILSNTFVINGGESLGIGDGLSVFTGELECASQIDRFYLDDSEANSNVARVLMENGSPIEGYSVSLCHDPNLMELREVEVGNAALSVGAEFSTSMVMENGGTLTVILDIEQPFDGQTIPPGSANHIANFQYECMQNGPQLVSFCNDLVTTIENTLVAEGRSIQPLLVDGMVDCQSDPMCPPENCANQIDDDCDGHIDGADTDCGVSYYIGPLNFDPVLGNTSMVTEVGASVTTCFYLQTVENGAVGDLERFDHVQGFSMAVEFDCRLRAEDSLDISGTMLETLQAEFVSMQVDNEPLLDDDGCELVIAVLVDAMPPFDGATIPPLDFPQCMGCVKMTVADNPDLCGTCLTIGFVDGVDGTEGIPTPNLVSAENAGFRPLLHNSEICVFDPTEFYRGDCNFSGGPSGLALNIGDAGALLTLLFFQPFEVQCLDACDCNDDGRLDISDILCILRYLFDSGDTPPPPGPGILPFTTGDRLIPTGPGPDPTADELDCVGGGNMCL